MYVNRFIARKTLEDPAVSAVPEDELYIVNALYDSGVAYADQQIGRLLSFLEKHGFTDRTIIILTSDHGESLGEKGLAGHSSLEKWELRVPLIISVPGSDERSAVPRVARQVRTVDIAPTILSLADMSPPDGIQGRSLEKLLIQSDASFENEAVSYAASTNCGLSVSSPNLVRYMLNNSPWDPVWGDERVEFIGISSTDSVPSLTEYEQKKQELRENLIADYLDRKAGLRMRLSNPEATPLTIGLIGAMVSPYRVKSFDSGDASFQWQRGEMLIEVSPGRSLEIFFEGVPTGRINVAVPAPVGANEGKPGRVEIDLGDGSREWSVSRTNGALSLVAGDDEEAGTVIIQARIHGSVGGIDQEFVLDEETAEALRNLGYIQ
jgi:hypothetical protein